LMPGSMKQMKEDFDQRAIELKKVIAQVTDELTALGLNYNATPSKVLQEKKKGSQKDDPISEFMDATIG
ncbi:MAG: hypothetical protein IJX68_04750, partial [Rikenellaceae bacterium]|nr:hypothetical protein [Rikenellaceae bacterium]